MSRIAWILMGYPYNWLGWRLVYSLGARMMPLRARRIARDVPEDEQKQSQ